MKKRIGILEGKPIITGDKNLKTSNEIHISDLRGGSGSGESSEDIIYYKINQDWKADNESYRNALSYGSSFYFIPDYAQTSSYVEISNNVPTYNSQYCLALAFIPQTINTGSSDNVKMVNTTSLEDCVEKGLLENINGIERCTKDEFYNSIDIVSKFRIFVDSSHYTGSESFTEEQGGIIKEYEFEPWMTWSDWFASKYNIDNMKPTVSEDGRTDVVSVSYCNNGNPTRIKAHEYGTIKFDRLLVKDFYNTFEHHYDGTLIQFTF